MPFGRLALGARRGPAALALAALLAGCAPQPSPTPWPTVPPTMSPASATASPAPTPTGVPLAADTVLYDGPGNVGYGPLGVLQAGTAVSPRATFVDFVEVDAPLGERWVTGFIPNRALTEGLAGLPELKPWGVDPEPLFEAGCSQSLSEGVLGDAAGALRLDNPTSEVVDTGTEEVSLKAAVRIRMDGFAVTGSAALGAAGAFKMVSGPSDSNPWWKDLHRMDLRAQADGAYVLWIRDGVHEDFYGLPVPGLSVPQAIQIVFGEPQGKTFRILDGNGRTVLTVDLPAMAPDVQLPNGLFPDSKASFGMNMAPYTSVEISGLRVGTAPDGTWHENAQAYPGLAALAAPFGLTIGTGYEDLADTEPRYCSVLRRNFNLLFITGMDTKYGWLGPDKYDFEYADYLVNRTLAQGWRVRGGLVWGDYTGGIPDWLLKAHYTKSQLLTLLEAYVKTTVGHFKGRVSEWIVVNEAISRDYTHLGNDFWFDKIGPEYIEDVFRWAREADPEAVLMFNDTNNESPRDQMTRKTTERMLAVVGDLKAKGVPIDGVGMQMHLLMSLFSSHVVPTKEGMLETMRRFGALGVKVYITELDVDLHDRKGSTAERLAFQAGVYWDVMEACLESKVCASFTTGVADASTWLMNPCHESWCIYESNADPLMFDRNYEPKPAYWAVRAVLLLRASAAASL